MVKNLPTVERSTKIRFGKNCTDDQAENTIVFNASNVQIDASKPGSIYMTPLATLEDTRDRSVTMLTYNTVTKEVSDSGVVAEDVINLDLDDAVKNGNVTTTTVSFNNAVTSVTTRSNVGIANGAPIHTLDVGSNLYVEDTGANVLTVLGDTYLRDDVVIGGDLEVKGTLTTINTENTTIKDAIIEIGKGNTSSDMGVIMGRTGTNVAMGYREGVDEFVIAHTTSSATSSTITPSSELINARVHGRLYVNSNLTVDTDTFHVDAVRDRVGINTLNPQTDFDVNGDAHVRSDFTVDTNTLFVDASTDRVGVNTLSPSTDFHVEGGAYVSGNVDVQTDLNVTGNAYVSSNAVVSGNVDVQTDLSVTGNAYLSSNAVVSGNVDVQTNLNVTNDAIVTGNVDVRTDLNVTGNAYVSSNVEVSGNVDVQTNLNVTGNVDVQTDLSVTGNVYMSSNAVVSGNVDVQTNLNVTNDAIVTGNVEASYFIGDGSELSNISLQQVTTTNNATSDTVQFTNADLGLLAFGNVQANYFIGNGSQLTATSKYATHVQVGGDIDGQGTGDESGYSVAMSDDGTRIAIGAPAHDSSLGNVRVYDYNGSQWTQVGLDIDGVATGEKFGWSVAMSSDGSRVAIGAPENKGVTNYNDGVVRVYDYNGSQWTSVGDIEGDISNYSGYSVAMSSDGSRIAIGEPFAGSNRGRARVYDYNGSQWTQVGLDIDGEGSNDKCGWSVAMSSDGSRVAVGAISNNGTSGLTQDERGHVRVYEYTGSAWNKIGDDIDGEAMGDESGWSVALSSDGSRVVIGAPFNDDNGDKSGHARVYEYSNSTWNKIGQDLDGEAIGDESGYSVAISSDGTRVAIGAPKNNGTTGQDSGHVRLYDYNVLTSEWFQVGDDIDGESGGDKSGWSVAMSSDGSRVVIGAPENGGSGHVRTYDVQLPHALDIRGSANVDSIAVNSIVATGNVQANYFIGNDLDVSGTANVDSITASNIVATGNIEASYFIGDGSQLSNIASNLQAITDNGNVTSNTVQFTNPTTALTTNLTSNVGIKLDQLANVVITTPQTDHLLVYDGSDWVNEYNIHNFIKVHNTTSSTLYKGNVVYIVDSFNNNVANVALAKSDSASTMPAIGLIHEDVLPGQEGSAVAYGKVQGIDTTGFTEGQTVYVSNTSAGNIMNTKPYGPNDQIQNVGVCIRVSQNNGVVFVTGVGRSNDIPNAPIVADESAINYVYVNDQNNDLKKIEPSNLLTQLQTLQQVTDTSNTTSNTVQFTNATTGLVTTSNIEVGDRISVGNLTTNKIPIVGAGNFLEDSAIGRANGTIVISSDLEVQGNILVDGNTYTVESNNLVINDRIIGIANNNVSHELDVGIIMQHPGKNVALIHHGEAQGDDDPHEHTFTIGYTQNTVTDNHVFDDSNLITVEILGNLITQNNLTVSENITVVGTTSLQDSVGISNTAPVHDLDVGSNLYIDDTGSNVLYVTGNVYATRFIGDGSFLENIASNLHEITTNGNVTTNTVEFDGSTALVTRGKVGVSNTAPIHDLDVGSNLYVDDTGSNVLYVTGNVYATRFVGDGSFLENIASNLHEITTNGNVTTNTIQLKNATSLVTTGNVGISNTAPVHDLDVGSNLYVDDEGSNVLYVTGNVYATRFIGDGSFLENIASNLHEITTNGNVTTNTVKFENATSLVTTGKVGISTNAPTASLHVTGNAYVSSNLEVASNVLIDGGLITNLGGLTKKTYGYSGGSVTASTTPEINVVFDSQLFSAKITAHLVEPTSNISVLNLDVTGGTGRNIGKGFLSITGDQNSKHWSSTVTTTATKVTLQPSVGLLSDGTYAVFVEYTSPLGVGGVTSIDKDNSSEITFTY